MEWKRYARIGTIEARPYVLGEEVGTHLSISKADSERITLAGGYVARNPANHDDTWYIAPEYFANHYGPLEAK